MKKATASNAFPQIKGLSPNARGPKPSPAAVKSASSGKVLGKQPIARKSPLKASSALAKACKAKSRAKQPGRRLTRRADTVTHPRGNEQALLFHGVQYPKRLEVLEAKIDLSLTAPFGDMHFKKAGTAILQPNRDKARAELSLLCVGCDGGFYLTDSIIMAAQFACHGNGKKVKTGEKVTVLGT